MNSVLLDTDVFSFYFKGDTRGDLYAREIEGKRLCLAFMSVAELTRWALAHNWGQPRRRSLEAAMQRCVVLPDNAAMAEAGASIAVERNRAGIPISCGDCWIAASAVRHGIPLVTHNLKHFGAIAGLKVVSHA